MKKTFQKGFTLIELVIVIAIIAILAVGVIAALNPIEQNNRAQDGKLKNTISEVMSAIQRYNTAQAYMPFCTSTNTTTCSTPSALAMWNAIDGSGGTVRSKLVDLGEMTANFTNVTSTQLLNDVLVTYTTANNQVALCYKPKSSAAKSDPLANYSSTGTGGSGCTQTSSNTCYFCVVQ